MLMTEEEEEFFFLKKEYVSFRELGDSVGGHVA